MSIVSIKDLLQAGVHFGHQSRFWNPKMEEYIFDTRKKISIINLETTQSQLNAAASRVESICSRGNKLLFVGTKRSASKSIREKLKKWNKIGINRLSLGVQTFDNNILKKLNRIHTAEMAISAIEEIKKIYNNYSIDLMFGTPGSTKKSIANDLFILKKLNPPHVSIYNMTLEKRTVFYKLFKNDKISLPNENLVLTQYDLIHDKLKKSGYENYEISNFSKKGYHSKHNSNYWKDKEYIGFGPSAHSYNKKYRFWNISDNKEYTRLINKGIRIYERERLSPTEKINEYILTRIVIQHRNQLMLFIRILQRIQRKMRYWMKNML